MDKYVYHRELSERERLERVRDIIEEMEVVKRKISEFRDKAIKWEHRLDAATPQDRAAAEDKAKYWSIVLEHQEKKLFKLENRLFKLQLVRLLGPCA